MLCRDDSKQPLYNMFDFAQCNMASWEILFNIKLNAELRIHAKFLHRVTEASLNDLFFVLMLIESQQNGLVLFGSPAFHSNLLCVCAGAEPVSNKDNVIGVDHERKRVRVQAIAYTGTHVSLVFIFYSTT
jgi:hypothetical protein